jgi:spectinomycin phosphotransferase
MLEPPDIPDEYIISSINDEFGLKIAQVTFLPIGYDVHTAVYRIEEKHGSAYFLKLRKGDFNPIVVEIPKYMNSHGISTIIAPLETLKGNLFGNLLDYAIILYPFILGKDGYELKLTPTHWTELGRTLKMVHSTQLPLSLTRVIPIETFNPQWRENVRYFQSKVEEASFYDPVAIKLSVFMKTRQKQISRIVKRAEELAYELNLQMLKPVLCHSDAHPGNYLIADNGDLYLVDWDNPVLAPKERDLMCFGSGMSDDLPGGPEEISFYTGYGSVDVNRKALAYYRYERIVQDIAEFCKQLLLTREGGEDREQAYQYFTSSFLPGHVVEVAFETDTEPG